MMRKAIGILAAIGLTVGVMLANDAPAKASNPGVLPLAYATNWVITVHYPESANQLVVLYYNYNQVNQEWKLIGHSNGTYSIQSVGNSSLCIDDPTSSNHVQYILENCDNSATQEFFFGVYGNALQIEDSYYGNCVADDGYVLANDNPIKPWNCGYPPPGWELWA